MPSHHPKEGLGVVIHVEPPLPNSKRMAVETNAPR